MTFKRKLLVAFCGMTVPLVVVVGQAAYNVQQERIALRRLDLSLSRAQLFSDVEKLTYRKVRKIRDYLSGLDPAAKGDFLRLDAQSRDLFSRWRAGGGDPAEAGHAARFESLDNDLGALAARLFSLFEAGRRDEAQKVVKEELNGSLLPALDATITTIYEIARAHDVQRSFADLEKTARSTTAVFIVTVFAAAAFSGAFSVIVARNLARPVEQLKRAIDVFGASGSETPPAVDLGGRDEIGDLARAFARMAERLGGAQRDLRLKIDSLRDAQSQLVQSEKLASLGQMAAAVAHGLRNPLASIRAATQLSLTRLAPDSPLREQLVAVIDEVDRLVKRIAHLLDFTKPAVYAPAPASLPSLLEQVTAMFGERMARQAVELRLECDAALPEAWIDSSQVEQAVIELVSNALESMPAGGVLAIGLRHRPAADGRSLAELTISDTGEGIAREALPRVGEPFFTTKADGTGLGVAIAKRFVEQNKGQFAITSLERGTRVALTLPLLPAGGASAA